MKKIKNVSVVNLLILVQAFFIIGCEKADEIIPEYIGNWVYEHRNSKIEMSLTEDSFVWVDYKDVLGEYYAVSVLYGDLIAYSKDSVFFIINKVMIDTSISRTNIPSNIYTEFNRGTDEFNERYGLGINNYTFDVIDNLLIIYHTAYDPLFPKVFNRIESIP